MLAYVLYNICATSIVNFNQVQCANEKTINFVRITWARTHGGGYAFYRIPNMLTQFSILKNPFTVFLTTGVNGACKIKLFFQSDIYQTFQSRDNRKIALKIEPFTRDMMDQFDVFCIQQKSFYLLLRVIPSFSTKHAEAYLG